jgi:hypothetical protein
MNAKTKTVTSKKVNKPMAKTSSGKSSRSAKSAKKVSLLSKIKPMYLFAAVVAVIGVAVTIGTHAGSVPPTISQLTATVVGPTQVNLSWVRPAGMPDTGTYRFYDNGNYVNTVDFAQQTSTAHAGTSAAYGVTPNASHTYYVEMSSGTTILGRTNSVTVTTPPAVQADTAVVAPATNLAASLPDTAGHVHLSWAPSPDTTVTGYNVYENGWYQGSTFTASFDNLDGTGSTYGYSVTAITASNKQSAAIYTSIAVPTYYAGKGSVQGVIKDTSGTALGGATVTATDSAGKQVSSLSLDSPNISTLTASTAGQYGVDLDPGSYTLNFAAKGYTTLHTPVTVTANTTQTLNPILQAGTTTTTSNPGKGGGKH